MKTGQRRRSRPMHSRIFRRQRCFSGRGFPRKEKVRVILANYSSIFVPFIYTILCYLPKAFFLVLLHIHFANRHRVVSVRTEPFYLSLYISWLYLWSLAGKSTDFVSVNLTKFRLTQVKAVKFGECALTPNNWCQFSVNLKKSAEVVLSHYYFIDVQAKRT